MLFLSSPSSKRIDVHCLNSCSLLSSLARTQGGNDQLMNVYDVRYHFSLSPFIFFHSYARWCRTEFRDAQFHVSHEKKKAVNIHIYTHSHMQSEHYFFQENWMAITFFAKNIRCAVTAINYFVSLSHSLEPLRKLLNPLHVDSSYFPPKAIFDSYTLFQIFR